MVVVVGGSGGARGGGSVVVVVVADVVDADGARRVVAGRLPAGFAFEAGACTVGSTPTFSNWSRNATTWFDNAETCSPSASPRVTSDRNASNASSRADRASKYENANTPTSTEKPTVNRFRQSAIHATGFAFTA